MNAPTLAEFDTADAVTAAAERVRKAGFRVLDALTPFPIPALAGSLGRKGSALRPAMAAAGFGTAIFAFWSQWYTAVHAYAFNSGARPNNSWPVFVLVPFEVGVLAAAAAGFVFFLWRCGLPRLHHPLFNLPNVERATQDRFFLIVEGRSSDLEDRRLRRTLSEAGALSLSEIEP